MRLLSLPSDGLRHATGGVLGTSLALSLSHVNLVVSIVAGSFTAAYMALQCARLLGWKWRKE